MTCSIRCEVAQTFAAVAFAAVEVRTGLCRLATRGHSGPPSRLRSSQPPGSSDRGWVSSCLAKKDAASNWGLPNSTDHRKNARVQGAIGREED